MLKALVGPSRRHVDVLAAHAVERPLLAKALSGAILDIGAGSGAFAFEAASRFNPASATGIDAWEPAVDIARAASRSFGPGAAIRFRLQDATQIEERSAFDAVWSPAPYLAHDASQSVLDRVTLSLKTGAYLIIGNVTPLSDDAMTILEGLRLFRSSGHLWRAQDLTGLMRSRGFLDIETLDCGNGAEILLGRRP